MNAEELRIGNLVSNIYTNKEYRITPQRWINLLMHFYPKDDSGVSMCYIKPIPITEEWLIKLGFKTNSMYWSDVFSIGFDRQKKQKGFSLKVEDGRFFFTKGNTGVKSYQLTEVKYIHQLQNLYYALTNEELKCGTQ